MSAGEQNNHQNIIGYSRKYGLCGLGGTSHNCILCVNCSNCVFLFYRFLFEVQLHSKINKMNVENLATVMGINLLKPQIEDPITVMKGKNMSPLYPEATDL